MPERMGGQTLKEIVVYHGSTDIVKNPVCKLGRKHLDFGQGFYITDRRDQAITWAKLIADRRGLAPVLNRYRLQREAFLSEGKSKIFEAYDKAWLEFIVANRRGEQANDIYDYVEGGVANDRVVDTVNLYMAGLMDEEMALRRLSEHQPNNQMCLLNQELTDKYLAFDGTEAI